MSSELDIKHINYKMKNTINIYKIDISTLRTGRISINILDTVMVFAYEKKIKLKSIATISILESRMLNVNIWDTSLINIVDKAIRNANLGLNPIIEGQNLRIPIPELNEERRKNMLKIVAKHTEACRIAIRNIRRDGMEILKKAKKNNIITKDEQYIQSNFIQISTNKFIKQIDNIFKTKEIEILQI